jgi:hypothetical protein
MMPMIRQNAGEVKILTQDFSDEPKIFLKIFEGWKNFQKNSSDPLVS